MKCVRSVVFANLASVLKCEEVEFYKDVLVVCTGEIKGVSIRKHAQEIHRVLPFTLIFIEFIQCRLGL